MMINHFTHGFTGTKCFYCDEIIMCWNNWIHHQKEYHSDIMIDEESDHQSSPLYNIDYELYDADEVFQPEPEEEEPTLNSPPTPKQTIDSKINCYFCPSKICKKSIAKHMKRKHFKNGASRNCLYCDDKYNNWKSFRIHIQLMHENINDDEEAIIGYPTIEEKQLNFPSDVTECKICGKRFKNKSFHDIHMSTSHKKTKRIRSKSKKNLLKSTKEESPPPPPSTTAIASNDPSLKETEIVFVCSFCSIIFNSKVKLLAHLKIGCSKKVKCQYCCFCMGEKFFNNTISSHLHDRHFIDIRVIKNRKCLLCLYEGKLTFENWLQHINDNHTVIVVQLFKAEILKNCKECLASLNFKCYGQEDEHFELVHSIKNAHKCDKCSASFENQLLLADHSELHNHLNMPTCQYCNQIFQFQLDLELHLCGSTKMTEHIESNIYQCLQCNIVSENSIEYDKHYSFHRKQPKRAVKPNNSQCLKNIQMDHGYLKPFDELTLSRTKLIICPHCDVQFASVRELKNHMKLLHKIDYRALCWICGELFTTNEICVEHQELNHNEIVDYCDVYLDHPLFIAEKIDNETTATRKIVRTTKLLKCTQCRKNFRNLELHMKLKHSTNDDGISSDKKKRRIYEKQEPEWLEDTEWLEEDTEEILS